MHPPRQFKLLPIAMAIAASAQFANAAEPVPAPAATSASAPAATPVAATKPSAAVKADAEANQLESVVVTGTARHTGQKKLATSFSISTASEEQIKEAAPSSTADLLKIVPGIYVETSGGTAGANIEVRGFPTGGDAPYVTIQLDGVPLFPAATLSFMENSSLFRIDDTVERVEVLRGGPSPIWSNGQSGATANFIQKKGSDESEGSLRFTTGTGNLARFDGYWGGKIADKWYLSGGGFWRTSDGVRNTGYPADEGYQASLNLTRKLDDGEVTVWGRTTHDRNTFFTAIPLVSSNGGNDISGFPGIDPLRGALQGNAIRNVVLETSLAPVGGKPGTMNVDLADGRGLKSTMLGLDYNQKFGAWTISDKAGYMSGDVPTKAIFTGGTPDTLANYLAGKVKFANTKDSGTGLTTATGGTATYLDGSAVNPNQQVLSAGIWSVDKSVSAVTNDLRANVDLGAGHTLTLGSYLARSKSHDLWYLGNSMLMTAQDHARPIDVVLNNGVQVTRSGFDGASFYSLDANYTGKNVAFTVADDWQINKQFRVDGGVRWERESVTGIVGQPSSGDLDRNPLTLYNNNASYITGATKPIDFSASKLSYTLGGAYMITPNLNTFVRLNSGVRFPAFDDLRDGHTDIEKIKQYEVGIKAADKTYSVFLTGFYNTFTGQPFQQFVADATGGHNVTYLLSSKAYGLEFEGAVRPMQGLEFAFGGNYARAKFVDSGTLTGNQVQRQPKLQARFTPSYKLNTDWGSAKVFATYAYTGKRFGDVDNQQPLPAYHTVDAGFIVNVNNFELRLTGTNLTNTIGITEGNARVIGSGASSSGVFLGRPIFGRAFEISAAMHF